MSVTVSPPRPSASLVAASPTRSRSVGSIKNELIRKSGESALTAVQLFNNPLVQFKSESYIVLMVIAWTYMLHAYYRGINVDYRYRTPDGRKFLRTTHGRIRYWELEKCLSNGHCPLDAPTTANLKLLIGIRHEIEHQMAIGIDEFLNPHLQSCALNFSRFIRDLFGEDKSIDQFLSFAIQLRELSREQVEEIGVGSRVPKEIRQFVLEFEASLPEDIIRDDRYAVLINFERKLVNNPKKADHVVTFNPPSDSNSASLPIIVHEREFKKYLVKSIVRSMKELGYLRFNTSSHTKLWQNMDAKKPERGYGNWVEGQWFWYEAWLEEVRKHCEENSDRYS